MLVYEGSHQKIIETSITLNPMLMGTRVYIPALGRFTGMDQAGGGNANSYVYPGDPVNSNDISGKFPMCVVVLAALWALTVADASKQYQDNPSTGNLIWLGIAIIPGADLTYGGRKGVEAAGGAIAGRAPQVEEAAIIVNF